jgi:hypothetical protein
MPKIHYFQRYSSPENTVTNNTLQLLARIYDYSPSQAAKLLTELTGHSIEIGIEITQQERGSASVPDGSIIQRSFKVLLEAKVDSGVDTEQLLNHADHFASESQRILLLLTKHPVGAKKKAEIAARILAEHPGVIFRSITYEDICKAISGLFEEYEQEICPLVNDYVEYCNDTDLFDQSPYLMRIVPCGDSFRLNRQFGVYFHPSDRGYTSHSYVGIYTNKAVRTIWSLDAVFDAEVKDGQLAKTLVQGRDTDEYDQNIVAIIAAAKTDCGYDVETGHRFFCGKPEDTEFRKTSPGGIQGARFENLREHIGEFEDVATVAQKLRDSTWE